MALRGLREGEDMTGITDRGGMLHCADGHPMGARKPFGTGPLLLRCPACKALVYFEAQHGLWAGWEERRQREQGQRTAGLSSSAYHPGWPGQTP